MSKMKKRIDFQKLLDGLYSVSTELQVFNWMLKTGLEYSEYVDRWTKNGVDKSMYGYSANNYESNTDVGYDFDKTMFFGFCHVLANTPNSVVTKWKEAENIFLGKYRMLDINNDIPLRAYNKNSWNLDFAIKSLYKYKDRFLKEKYFLDYEGCTKPQIYAIKFTTHGNGYIVTFDFNFKECRDSGWNNNICQKENESVDCFVNRAHFELSKLVFKGN